MMFSYLSNFLDVGIAQTGATILFALAFGMIAYGLLRLNRQSVDAYASIPLSDHLENSRHGD
jgi:cbb3-type cytochrome oxidase subunit 3